MKHFRIITVAVLIGVFFLQASVVFAAKQFQVDTGGTLTTNLRAYYKLEDVNDFFDNAFNLTNNNAVAFNAGKINNAADFGASNTNKYLSITNDLGITGGNISMSIWVNITTTPTGGGTYFLAEQSDAGIDVANSIFYRDNTGTPEIVWKRDRAGQPATEIVSAVTLTEGTWFNLVYTYDGTNIEGFVDTVSKGTTGSTGNGSNAINDIFTIGARNLTGSPSLFTSGLVDEVGVWSKELSGTEISDLYNGGSGQTMVDITRTDNIGGIRMGFGF